MSTRCSAVRREEPCPGENLEEHLKNHDLILECQGSAQQKEKEKNSVLGGTLEDLHNQVHHDRQKPE